MKKSIVTTLLFTALFTAACQDESHVIDGLSDEMTYKHFTFNVKGDFSDKWKPVTRGTLSADGKELTDLWVLDYQNGALVQQLHQKSKDANFGTPSLNLSLGDHHVYFIASCGTSPTLSTANHTITWEKVNDTFYKDLAVTVEPSANGDRTVTLDRSVTKLKLTIADAIKKGTAGFRITPQKWYYGIDYFTGRPDVLKTNEPIFVDCTSSIIGKTNQEISVYGFSSTTEWTNDITLYATDGTYITAKANITHAPFKRNRATEYTGSLFETSEPMTLIIDDTWDDPESGTW